MPLSSVQGGRIGEFLLAVYAMLTTDGTLVPFQVDADDDHRDLVVAVKGKGAFASLQAKTAFELDPAGFVHANAIYFPNSVPSDPGWIYVVLLMDGLAPSKWWCVPAPDFNRLASHTPVNGGRQIELHFHASPDRDDAAAAFRVDTHELGSRLLKLIDALPPDTKPLAGARLVMSRRNGR